ncbi:MAG: DUF378 domain-containing protein [Candidatus Pacearchaeota archaeon]|jgi:uncharacterized membrane protein YuzA (DUF378 family)
MKMGAMGWITTILVVIGGINWGLIGFFSFNLVEAIFGTGILTSVIYALVGLSTLWMIYAMSKM